MTVEEDIRAICAYNPFMQLLGVEPREMERDRMVFALTLNDHLLNPYGIAHGGVLFSLADNTAGMAARGDGRSYVTLSSSFNFLRPGKAGDTIQAEAKVRRRGGATCYVNVDITDSAGELLASGNSVFFCIEK